MAAVGGEHEPNPDLAGVTGEMRAEWQAEQADAARDAAEQWRHTRTLGNWLEERMHAGDRIAVNVGGTRYAGLVEEIGPDLIGLRCVFGRVDVHVTEGVSLFIEINDKALSGGTSNNTRRTFRDVLYERDGSSDYTVGTLHEPEGLDGTLYVGQDFVSIVAKLGAETVVPIHAISWISTRR